MPERCGLQIVPRRHQRVENHDIDVQEPVTRVQAECIVGFTQVGGCGTGVSGDWSPLGMVKYIERLCTEVDPKLLGQAEGLGKADVLV